MFANTACRSTVRLTSVGSRATNVRTGASLRDIRNRIKSITSISKLTKTMQLVASSRIKSATVRSENAQHLQRPQERALSVVEPDREHGTNLVITVASDKGMCGSVNTTSAKTAKTVANEDRSRFYVASVGTKTVSVLSNEYPDTFLASIKDLGKPEFNFPETCQAVDQLLDSIKATSSTAPTFDNVHIVFNKFKSIITYLPTEIVIPGLPALTKDINKFAAFEFEELEQTTLRDLFEYQVATSLWGAINSNRTSELAARMTSMDNATKNANKIVADLTVAYNRGRQAAITTELVEITSGASAVQEGANDE